MIPIAKPLIGEEEKQAVMEVLNSGMLAQGPKVAQLEKEYAELCGTAHAVAVNSGTAALHAALYAMGITQGHEVITTPFTFVATANSIIMQNAKPVFADINPKTALIDVDAINEKITKNTKAIIPVDLYGQVHNHKAIRELAEDHNLFILEDAAQAVNASADGKMAGSFGDMAAFSFYATKNLISGEGGIITTDNADYAERARRFRHHGQSEQTRYQYYDLGYNYRMMDIQAAIALCQLHRIDTLTNARISNAEALTRGLKGVDWCEPLQILPGNKHVYHQYTIRVFDGETICRDLLLEHMRNAGIGYGIYYPKPLHLHPNFSKFGYKEGDFPRFRAFKQGISLSSRTSTGYRGKS